MKQHILISLVAGTCISSVAFAAESDTYSNDFSNDGGTHYGTSFITTYNGHADLQLVSDGQPGTYGTWKISEFDGRHISAFNASFKFSYNTNGNGGVGDGFSFLFGDMSDMTGNRWEGGEYGLNAFTDMSSGMSIGFDSYNDSNSPSGIYARWGGKNIAWTNFGPEWYEIANYGDYNQALDDYWQGTIYINWDDQTGLQVGVSWPGHDTWWGLSTGMFTGSIMDTTNFGFGFAARNGGIDNDVLIDNFNVTYTYYDDCNGNVSPDIYDIKSGDSQDCNGNMIPDECDFTNGTSEDLNSDGIPDECQCLGDIVGDGYVVNVQDILVLISHWNTSESSADIDGNGNVGVSDLLIIIDNWGPCSTP